MVNAYEHVPIPIDLYQVVSGSPASEICRISETIGADVVVLGNKSSRSVRGRLMGNTAEKVLHKISADVIVVK